MNETLSTIDRRRSIRAFSEEPLSRVERDAILHAAMRAPTAGNMMLYTVLEIDDPALKARLAETCDHQPFIAKAPFVLVFAADYQRWFDYYTLSGAEDKARELGRAWRTPAAGDLLLACCDALIAAQNAVIAAESLGISSCYIGDILENYEIHRDLLALPRYVAPVTLLCFGRPLRAYEGPSPVSRFEPEFIVHKNTYHRLDEAELTRMFQTQADKAAGANAFLPGAENLGQHQYLRKFGADFSIEMTRSVRAMLKNWGEE
jgi:FMN reductase (NADPH)/FMN reductase [NAD(P)H]